MLPAARVNREERNCLRADQERAGEEVPRQGRFHPYRAAGMMTECPSSQIQELTEKARQNEQQLIDNLNRDHGKVCEKLHVDHEQAKEQFVENPSAAKDSVRFLA